MPSEVRHLVDDGQTYPVVRLTGVLDADTEASVRNALLDVLAGQPVALLVDVSDLRIPDPGHAVVLRDLVRDTADWPGAQVVLLAPAGADPWRGSGLPVWRSQSDALAELGEPDHTQYRRLALEPVVGAARRSREAVTAACGGWDLPDLAGPACIVVTELVNNVVSHAHTSMDVLLARHGDSISVAVRDHSAGTPRYSGPVPPTAYGGRGLLLIDSVSDRWGCLQLAGGKVVWAVLVADPSPDQPQLDEAGMTDQARG